MEEGLKKFNINEKMYVQINENGWEHLKNTVGNDYIKHCIKPYEEIINGETWYGLQCHNVFDLLPVNYGGRPLFNTNVMFKNKSLNNVKNGK